MASTATILAVVVAVGALVWLRFANQTVDHDTWVEIDHLSFDSVVENSGQVWLVAFRQWESAFQDRKGVDAAVENHEQLSKKLAPLRRKEKAATKAMDAAEAAIEAFVGKARRILGDAEPPAAELEAAQAKLKAAVAALRKRSEEEELGTASTAPGAASLGERKGVVLKVICDARLSKSVKSGCKTVINDFVVKVKAVAAASYAVRALKPKVDCAFQKYAELISGQAYGFTDAMLSRFGASLQRRAIRLGLVDCTTGDGRVLCKALGMYDDPAMSLYLPTKKGFSEKVAALHNPCLVEDAVSWLRKQLDAKTHVPVVKTRSDPFFDTSNGRGKVLYFPSAEVEGHVSMLWTVLSKTFLGQIDIAVAGHDDAIGSAALVSTFQVVDTPALVVMKPDGTWHTNDSVTSFDGVRGVLRQQLPSMLSRAWWEHSAQTHSATTVTLAWLAGGFVAGVVPTLLGVPSTSLLLPGLVYLFCGWWLMDGLAKDGLIGLGWALLWSLGVFVVVEAFCLLVARRVANQRRRQLQDDVERWRAQAAQRVRAPAPAAPSLHRSHSSGRVYASVDGGRRVTLADLLRNNRDQQAFEVLLAQLLVAYSAPRAPVAPRSVLDGLSKRAATADDAQDNCTICCEDYVVGGEVTELPCSHVFHTACVGEWLGRYNNTCPLCRVAVG